MPELPDLQAFSHNLSKKLAGKKVKQIRVLYRKKLKTGEKELQGAIAGATLLSVYREGKELHFAFDNGNVVGLHLMLKGELHLFRDKNEKKYPIIELIFDDGTGLAMSDWQGQANATLNPEPREAPDAMSRVVNVRFLKAALGKSKAAIKKFLTDQQVIRGIGNTYADEILWDCGISPFSICNKIPDAAVKSLAKSIRSVMTRAEKKILKHHPDIISGEVRDFLPIHNPKKQQSPNGAEIRVDQTGGRKTYYTDEQKLYR